MSKFKDFLFSLGDLHDANVSELHLDFHQGVLRIEIDNIYVNFQGTPEYKGARVGCIVFREIRGVSVSLQQKGIDDKVRICDFSVLCEAGDGGTASIKFWPEGSIILDYGNVEFPVDD